MKDIENIKFVCETVYEYKCMDEYLCLLGYKWCSINSDYDPFYPKSPILVRYGSDDYRFLTPVIIYLDTLDKTSELYLQWGYYDKNIDCNYYYVKNLIRSNKLKEILNETY